jgi:hypothetical protein
LAQFCEQQSLKFLQTEPFGRQRLQLPRSHVSDGQHPLPQAEPIQLQAVQWPASHCWLQQSANPWHEPPPMTQLHCPFASHDCAPGQVPQLPVQPSEPHCLPLQLGMQMPTH